MIRGALKDKPRKIVFIDLPSLSHLFADRGLERKDRNFIRVRARPFRASYARQWPIATEYSRAT